MKTAKAKSKKSGGSGGVPTLDLHGFTVDQVFDAIEAFLGKHQDKDRVRIMPGKGTGKVQAEAARYLKLANYSWSFEHGGPSGLNAGVMIVFMD